MLAFADKKFWELIAEDLARKTGLGKPSGWKKSMIENFIYDFLDDLEVICAQDEKKAVQCNIPVVRNAFAYGQLTFSYDSFRRIFITRESNGNKTTKNMFAIYLGYDSFIDYWMKSHEGNGKEESLTVVDAGTEGLGELHTLCLNRLKGSVKIDQKFIEYIQQSKTDYDIAIVELSIHFFAKHKYKKPQLFESLKGIHIKPLQSDFAKRAMKVLACIELLESGDKGELMNKYREAKRFNRISRNQAHYLAFWEGLILLACEKYEACDSVWVNLSGHYAFDELDDYPFIRHSRPFDRAIFKILLGDEKIEEIVSQLDLKGYRGLAHLSAVNCKVIRKCEYILHNLIEMGAELNWKKMPDFQTSWERLLQFEKLVLSNSGTLL